MRDSVAIPNFSVYGTQLDLPLGGLNVQNSAADALVGGINTYRACDCP